MSTNKDSADFPNLEAKLQKPTKQSAFEKQRADAEAKRKREAAETAAVYADFVKSFDRDDDDNDFQKRRAGEGGPGAGRGGRPSFGGGSAIAGGPFRRHFGTSGLKSGPGSLGPSPNAFGKKRSFQDFSKATGSSSGTTGSRDNGRTAMGFEDHRTSTTTSVAKVFEASDDEDMIDAGTRSEEKAMAKPTLRLSNIPPGTSPATIKALMPANLAVENVKILPQSNTASTSTTERKSLVAIVIMSQETPANDMDATVSALQNRYMGYGYYLSLHRHLSSAVATSTSVPNLLASSSSSTHPFGAKPVEQPTRGPQEGGGSHGGGGPGFQQRGFAPPPSYGPGHGMNRASLLHVPVKPPQDIKMLKLINMVIEGVLEHGPEFEALLMTRPEVQREERWAWIWDARSEGGIWLRWHLWEVVTGASSRKSKGKFVPLFDGGHAWKTPDKALPFEYTTSLDDFVSDSDYNSSDDDDLEDEVIGRDGNRGGDVNDKTFLNPLEKAKLAHLLARLPTTISKLRKGDIARVTAFAIMHSSRGADEVVDMIVTNVERPFSVSRANIDRHKEAAKDGHAQASTEEIVNSNDGQDAGAASLVGLYVVNDVLSSSSTSGVRHAWRYRQLFDTTLQQMKTFEKLGGMAEKLGWGRLRAEKWKRSVGLILNLWEGWCVFPTESQSLFTSSFDNTPSTKITTTATATATATTTSIEEPSVKKGRWKVVDDAPQEDRQIAKAANLADEGGDDVEGEAIEDDDIEGEPIEDDDIEGEPIDDDDIEGEPIEEDDVEGEAMMDEDEIEENKEVDNAEAAVVEKPPLATGDRARPGPSRQRMRAVDMFADSDEGE